MSRRWLHSAAVLLALLAAGGRCAWAQQQPGRRCAAIASDLAAARLAGRLAEATSLYGEAARPEAGCTATALFCLGRSVALAHVEGAYGASDAGDAAEAQRLFTAGRSFGAPWPLLVGLGDAAEGTARATHDPARWAAASRAYQQAVAAFDEPALCADEPPPPAAAAAEPILRKMALAMLLARPATFFHDRCAPCALTFLAHGPIDAAHPRALPITFEDRSAALTAEGALATKALADCARALRWPTMDVSVHTDERGGANVNLRLSAARGSTLRTALRADGYPGTVSTEPFGKRDPMPAADMVGLSPAEVERANRRVQLRGMPAAGDGSCASPERADR